MKYGVVNGLLVTLFLSANVALAVELNPTEEVIARTIEAGKADASTQAPAHTTNTIGKAALMCNGFGFLQTKLWNIRESSEANEKKMRPIKREEIDKALKRPTMLITFVYCSSTAQRSDDHMVLKQGDKIIQPKHVSNSPAELMGHSYAHTIQAHFAYADFDPTAESIIILIPDQGKRMEFPVNLSDYP
jgi:hypothetical protein